MTEHLRAVVVAFDGLVADTLNVRAQAIADALTSEGIATSVEDIVEHVVGHSLEETVEYVLNQHAAYHRLSFDHTTRDLAVLRARRSYTAVIALGLPLQPHALTWFTRHTKNGVRIILRADSARNNVEGLLQLSGIEDSICFARCADDLPRVRGLSTTVNSWNVIMQRLNVMQIMPTACRAIEISPSAAKIAQTVISDVVLASTLS